ncbi:MAG: hypothetical protein NC177_16485 [Ruminococcus flavefaciens]|nr:hypothetical protein [Ruminococcus flavefaciens]
MLKNCDIELLKRISTALNNHETVADEDCKQLIELIEQELEIKRNYSKKAVAYNKANPEKHREANKNCPSYKKKHKGSRKRKSENNNS